MLWYVDKMSRYHLTVTHRFWLVVILTINQTIATLYCAKVAVTILVTTIKALKSVPTVEPTPASAAGNSSYQFGQMPDIAAMPAGRKVTASVK